jgi:hypothetical protein
VVQLRETFEARGIMRSEGSLRQWTNGNLQALLEPTATGQRIRLRTIKGEAKGGLAGGLIMSATSGTLLTAMLSLQGAADVGAILALSLAGLTGVAVFAGQALRLPRRARTRARQMEELARRLEETRALPESSDP